MLKQQQSPRRRPPSKSRSGDNNPFFSGCSGMAARTAKCSKHERLSVGTSVIEQAKIQAQVLVPLVKALQAELGEERANSLVRTTLGDIYRRYGEEFRRTRNQNNLGTMMASAFATYAREDALDYRVIEQSQDAFEFDVVECRYAEFYKELGEPELGFLLVCSADFPTAEGIGPDIELTRTQTIMQGASHCDFRYKRRK
jgi:L-2-amino-thiazoline-4-carboxylic acid hydrolase